MGGSSSPSHTTISPTLWLVNSVRSESIAVVQPHAFTATRRPLTIPIRRPKVFHNLFALLIISVALNTECLAPTFCVTSKD